MAKTIEEKYTEMSELDHILHRPGMYVGSVKEEESEMFVMDDEGMVLRSVTYVPALLKIVDEVISNSCDEYRRPDNMGLDTLEVDVIGTSTIRVRDNGGIPVVVHKTANCYLPEFIFGRLRTSSNYNDDDVRNVVGTNGVGSALCNVFSKRFYVSTSDGVNAFSRSWTDNMRILCDDVVVKKSKKSSHHTLTEFEVDFDRFETNNGFNDDFYTILHKRCVDAAGANMGLKVIYRIDGRVVGTYKFKKQEEYLTLYNKYINVSDSVKFENTVASVYVFPDSNIDIAFVNGAGCGKGTHVRHVRGIVNSTISDHLKKKDKIEIAPRNVDNKYSIYININVSNPSYDSQTKDTLTTPVNRYTSDGTFDIPSSFISNITKSEIVNIVRDWYTQKMIAEDAKMIRKLNNEAKKGLKRPDKYIMCSNKRPEDRELWIFEGDSASSGFRAGRIPTTQSGYLCRGVPKNVIGMSPAAIMKNEVFNDLVNILGLRWGPEYDIKDLQYSKIIIASDADVDGDKIASLLLVFFNNWPVLFERGIVVRSVSPIIISRKGKDVRMFYRLEDFKREEKTLKGYTHKYTKGLGGLNMEETKAMYHTPIFSTFDKDTLCDSTIRKWFGKGDADVRKGMLSGNIQ